MLDHKIFYAMVILYLAIGSGTCWRHPAKIFGLAHWARIGEHFPKGLPKYLSFMNLGELGKEVQFLDFE